MQVVTSHRGDRVTSRPLPNPIGTYQGSALGPLLYSIYANDLSLYVQDATIVQYADDTQVLVSGRPGDIGALITSMEQNLALLSQWFCKNGLLVNAQKNSAHCFRFTSKSAAASSRQLTVHGCHCRRVFHGPELGCHV